MDAPHWLRGSMPPLVTPLRDEQVDVVAYSRLVRRQVDAGSHGIVVNGTTAEPSLLTVAERNQLVDVAVDAAQKTPVVAATGSQNLVETTELSRYAVEAGADALLVVTPYYVRPPQSGLVEYFARLNAEFDVPWLLYHIPGRAAVDVSVGTLERLREVCPTFVGMKHAVDDLRFVTDVHRNLGDDFRVFVGLEHLSFPMMAVGACGLMNAVGNVLPRRLVDLVDMVDRGDLAGAREMHRALARLNDAVFWEMNPIPIKYMMKRLGLLDDDEHRPPMQPATPDLARHLDALLTELGLSDAELVRA